MIVTCFLVLCLPGIAPAATKSPPPIMEITFQNDLISAELVDAPLIDVLQRIKQEFGFKAHFHGDLTEPITMSFKELPLEKCLRLLTANQAISVASEIASASPEQSEIKQIAEVWVLSRSAKSKTRNTSPAAPAPPTPEPTDDTGVPSEEPLEQFDIGEQEGVSLEQILNTPNADKSNLHQAIQRLIQNGDAASVMAMAAFLDNGDKEVRQLLVDGISSINNAESTQVLGQVAQNEPDPEIRNIALQALVQRKDDAAGQAHLENAVNEADEEVKNTADQLLSQ
jgi:HEAT repeat protein